MENPGFLKGRTPGSHGTEAKPRVYKPGVLHIEPGVLQVGKRPFYVFNSENPGFCFLLHCEPGVSLLLHCEPGVLPFANRGFAIRTRGFAFCSAL
jgi:hypothetical protein